MILPRIMITAPASGSGKTLITCGILQALVNRGLKVSSFKCGPDYIDPMFHSRVIGTPSRNLDPFFTDDNLTRYLFSRSAEGQDISVIEGVMGFYDGLGIVTDRGSTHDVSQRLSCPVILVVNCKGASLSVVPVIKGFMEFRQNNIKGVILNNMSESVYREVSKFIEKELNVKVIGYVPKVSELVLESRHLGLCLPGEIDNLKDKLNKLASVFEDTMDLDLLIRLSQDVPELSYDAPKIRRIDGTVKIALADDEAFCFTYEDNIKMLQECGAEIVRFSPIHDKKLPDGVQGVIFSGGYPELHAKALSDNTGMIEDVRKKISAGLPCMAECGGFMYLHREIEDSEGIMHPMVGIIDTKVVNMKRLNRFGYIKLESKGGSQILPEGCVIKAHEFHYWDSDDCGDDCIAEKTNGKRYGCMHLENDMVAGFPHLYYYSNPDVAYNFLKLCSSRWL
ncbi:MAG: cobyrinate a,c-diamide synthase [Candidatus Methanogranum gryphiswaldense]|nr:MAG: cobyrinate a,c-diamide synthase [Candidatus Methanogranum sp. U3.2.1]